MAITNYLVHFKTEATYKSNKSQLRPDAVAFVKDATIIHTHGTDYYCGSGPVALESDLANYATTSALTSGLATKANTSHTHTISQITSLQSELDSKIESLSDLGITATSTELNYVDGVTSNIQTQLNNKAASSHNHSAANITSGTLDIARLPSITDAKITSVSASKITGTIPQANLPSYVDDVLEYSSKSSFPQTGETGKIYVDTTTNLTYRWGGSAYVEISPSLALGETSSTAYRGDRGKTAYDHSQATGNPHNLTLANLGISATAAELNYVDGVTSNIQTQLNGKAASSHNHNASNINAGTLNIARIPTGTSATTVALGNHTHSDYLQKSVGTYSIGWDDDASLYIGEANSNIGMWVSIGEDETYVNLNNNRVLTSANYSDYITTTDTKNTTGSSNSTSKLFLIGASSQSPTGVQTYSNSDVYMQDGNLLLKTGDLSVSNSGTLFGGKLNIRSGIFLVNDEQVTFNPAGSDTFSLFYSDGISLTLNDSIGSFTVNGGVGTFSDKVNAVNGFYETSDARLKNFKDDIKALDVISEIPTKYFTWKKDETDDPKLHIGTSAQEIQKIYPDLVTENEEGELSVDYARLSVIALAAIKELKKEIEELKSIKIGGGEIK